MDSDVPHDADGPVFYQKDIIFTNIIVDEVVKQTSYGSVGQRFMIYYAGKTLRDFRGKLNLWNSNVFAHHKV